MTFSGLRIQSLLLRIAATKKHNRIERENNNYGKKWRKSLCSVHIVTVASGQTLKNEGFSLWRTVICSAWLR
jgi:hypothetical protein